MIIRNRVLRFGDDLVQRGTSWCKSEEGMDTYVEFKQLFPILKKHLSDGADIPYFFRDLIAMITNVTEAEWGSEKDPSTKLTNDETLRSYTKRKLPKKFAQAIVYRLTPEVLIARINKRPATARRLLAEDLHGYDPGINEDNVGKAVADWLVDIIRGTAGYVAKDELEQLKQQQITADLKAKYGEYLLNEAGVHCQFPGCGKSLAITHNEKVIHTYEVSLIDKSKAPTIENLLAMCPQCHATYLLDEDKKLCKRLQGIKAMLNAHSQSIRLLDDLPLEKGIVGVVQKITALNEKDLSNAELDPKELKDKICPEDNMALYLTVKNYVTAYYIRIKEIMMNLDKRGDIDYDEMQDQMRAIYKRLKKAKKTSLEIFNEITGKIHRASLQADVYCQIVVSYFIQSCEVFDAISK